MLSGVTKDSSSPPQAVEDLESCEKTEEEGAEKKESPEEPSAEESPTKMDVDPPDSPSDEEQSMSKLVSDSNTFSCMLSWATCYFELFFFFFHFDCPKPYFESELFFFPGSVIKEEKTSMKEQPAEGPARPFNHDVVDVSRGFLTRIPYKKKVKSSKLDCLLERRLKQHVIEERQRASASNPQAPAASSSTSTSVLSTPARPRSPLKPHSLAQVHLALGEAVKAEEKSSTTQAEVGGQEVGGGNGAEPSKTLDETVPPPVPSPATTSTPKDNYSTVTDENQITSVPQELKADLVGRTTGPKDTNVDSSGQEGIKLPDIQKTTAGQIYSSGSEAPSLKSDSVRPSTTVFDPKSGQNTSPSKPVQQNAETLGSVHLGTEENGMGPVENQVNMQDVEQSRTASDGASESVSPIPQVNGNDGSGSDGLLGNSVLSSNNGLLTNSPQLKMNSFGKEQGQVVSLKGNAQQKRLVNGDLAPINDSTEVGPKEPSLASKAEVHSDTTISDQDYKPPLKVPKVENNIDANIQSARQHFSKSPFHSVDSNTSPVVKIIRMAPSPIPSAEESSLSDDFADENCHSGTTEPLKTTLTQVTTTSTTTTTMVVSTAMTTVKAPAKSSGDITTPVVSTTESSAVSTLTTMTKTTVTKICSSGFDGQSEDSQSEIVTQEQKTAISASMSKMTTGPDGETSVSSLTVSQEDSSSTKGRVRLLKFSRTKKMRSDTALPSYRKFVTKSNRRSIFVLPHDDLKVLGRRGGFREVPIFSYNAKPAWDIWPYPSPRPTFGITWR